MQRLLKQPLDGSPAAGRSLFLGCADVARGSCRGPTIHGAKSAPPTRCQLHSPPLLSQPEIAHGAAMPPSLNLTAEERRVRRNQLAQEAYRRKVAKHTQSALVPLVQPACHPLAPATSSASSTAMVPFQPPPSASGDQEGPYSQAEAAWMHEDWTPNGWTRDPTDPAVRAARNAAIASELALPPCSQWKLPARRHQSSIKAARKPGRSRDEQEDGVSPRPLPCGRGDVSFVVKHQHVG